MICKQLVKMEECCSDALGDLTLKQSCRYVVKVAD
jgi:hypothetical protein